MACVNHPDRDSVAKCLDCNVELCDECRVKVENKSYCALHADSHRAQQSTSPTSGISPTSGAEDRSSTNLEANVAGLLCYVLGWVSGLIFLIIENKSQFVKFHAYQSLLTFAGLAVMNISINLLRFLPGMGFGPIRAILSIAGVAISVATLLAWIIGMVQAYQGARYKFPIVGDMAEKYASND